MQTHSSMAQTTSRLRDRATDARFVRRCNTSLFALVLSLSACGSPESSTSDGSVTGTSSEPSSTEPASSTTASTGSSTGTSTTSSTTGDGTGTESSSASSGWMPTQCTDACSPVLVPQWEHRVSDFAGAPRDDARRIVGATTTPDGRTWVYVQDEQSPDQALESLTIVAADGASADVVTATDLGLTTGHTNAFGVSNEGDRFVLSTEAATAAPFGVDEYSVTGELLCSSTGDTILAFDVARAPAGEWGFLGIAAPSTESVFAYVGPPCDAAGAWTQLELQPGAQVIDFAILDGAVVLAAQSDDGRALVGAFESDGTERWLWISEEGPASDEVRSAVAGPDGWLHVGGSMDHSSANLAFHVDENPQSGEVFLHTYETLVQHPAELGDVRVVHGATDAWLVFTARDRYVVRLTEDLPCCPELLEESERSPYAARRLGDDLILAVMESSDGYDDVRVVRFGPG